MATYRKHGDFVARCIAGETILVPVRGQVGDIDSIFNLNEVAAFIWDRIDGQATVGQIAEAVAGEFEVEPEQAEADTVLFIARLADAGVIEKAAGE